MSKKLKYFLPLALFNLIDLVGTYFSVIVVKTAEELNPVMAMVLDHNPKLFILLKLLVMPLFWWFAKTMEKQGPDIAYWAVFTVYGIMSVIHIFNLIAQLSLLG